MLKFIYFMRSVHPAKRTALSFGSLARGLIWFWRLQFTKAHFLYKENEKEKKIIRNKKIKLNVCIMDFFKIIFFPFDLSIYRLSHLLTHKHYPRKQI